jgi:hypothetical protein
MMYTKYINLWAQAYTHSLLDTLAQLKYCALLAEAVVDVTVVAVAALVV